MKCTVCGAALERIITDMPFKVGPSAIVILKGLPVLQCRGCTEYLIEDGVMERVEDLLRHARSDAELQVLRYAA